MRIAVIFESSLPSSRADAEQFVNNAAALARHGHDVELLIPRPSGSLHDDRDEHEIRAVVLDYYETNGPLRVRELPAYSGNHTLMQLVLAARVVDEPSVVEADFLYTRNFATLTAALAAGRRVLFEHYRPWGDQYPIAQPYLREAMRRPEFLGMVVHSEFAAASYRAIGIPDSLLAVCHNGFEPRRMEPVLTREDARAKLGLPSDRPLAVYAGRMNEKKGLDVVLAMARAMPDVRFMLVGSTGQGSVERAAAGLANVLVAPWRTFSGVAPYLYAADVLVVPPSTSPLADHGNTVLPLKLFGYLAAGRPILAGDTPDVRELLRHDDNAWLVEPGNVASAVGALRVLLDAPARGERLAASASALARTLTWDARARRITDFVAARLADHRPHAIAPFAWGRFSEGSRRWAREILEHRRLRPAPLLHVDTPSHSERA